MTHNYSLSKRLLRSMRITGKTKPQRTQIMPALLHVHAVFFQIIASKLTSAHFDRHIKYVRPGGHSASENICRSCGRNSNIKLEKLIPGFADQEIAERRRGRSGKKSKTNKEPGNKFNTISKQLTRFHIHHFLSSTFLSPDKKRKKS